jgi:formylglycine-generating enzyme
MIIILGGSLSSPLGAAPFPANTEMILIEGGAFRMGSKTGRNDEEPVHALRLGSYFLSRYPVTRGEFQCFAEAADYQTSAEQEGGGYGLNSSGNYGYFMDLCWKNPGFDQGGDEPVVEVSWYDAIAYCNWLSVREGFQPCYDSRGLRDSRSNGYRLPTEAEWELAASGGNQAWASGSGEGFPWGPGRPRANVADAALFRRHSTATPWPEYDDGFVFTSPVGAFPPSRLGLFDLGGNVLQWCQDIYEPGYYADSPMDDPRGPSADTGLRTIRGASWKSSPEELATSRRNFHPARDRSSIIGFRLARSLP